MNQIFGITMMVAAGCSLFLVDSVWRQMPTRWLKFGVIGMLLSASVALGWRGYRMCVMNMTSDWVSLISSTTYSLSMVVVFLCVIGKLDAKT